MHPADAFLQALGKERATYQVFPDSEAAERERPIILHGPHRAQARALTATNERGMGIFTMINDGDLQGRKAENVTTVTAYFIDLDGEPLPDVLPAEPTVIVESSPNRFHAYWRITDDPPFKLFPHVQRHLALLFGSDPVVHDLPRVMRLPGYQHQKREPFETRILSIDTAAAYTHDEFADTIALPPLPPPPRKRHPTVQAFIDKHSGNARNQRRDPLATARARITREPEGNRNQTLYRVACGVMNDIREGRVDRREAEDTLLTAALDTGLPEFEARRTLQSAMRHAP